VELPAYALTWLAEEPAITAARDRARKIGIPSTSPDAGSLLRSLAQLVDARTAVETGTGVGISTLWLLSGMRPGATLTSIDREPEYHRYARQTFADAGVPAARVRLISSEAASVLPRLTEQGYDLAHLDCGSAENATQYVQMVRLVRPGGVVVVSGVFRNEGEGKALLELIAAEGDGGCTLLPVGEGVLIVSKPGHPA